MKCGTRQPVIYCSMASCFQSATTTGLLRCQAFSSHEVRMPTCEHHSTDGKYYLWMKRESKCKQCDKIKWVPYCPSERKN